MSTRPGPVLNRQPRTPSLTVIRFPTERTRDPAFEWPEPAIIIVLPTVTIERYDGALLGLPNCLCTLEPIRPRSSRELLPEVSPL